MMPVNQQGEALILRKHPEKDLSPASREPFATGWEEFVNVLVTSEEQWKQVFHVRRQAFAERRIPIPGWTAEENMSADPYVWTYLLYQCNQPVATIQTALNCVDGRTRATPAVQIFGYDVIGEATHGERFLDVSKHCVCQLSTAPDIRRTCAIFQNVTRDLDETRCRWLVAAMRDDYRPFRHIPGLRRLPVSAISPDSGYSMALFLLDWQLIRPDLLRIPGLADLIAPDCKDLASPHTLTDNF